MQSTKQLEVTMALEGWIEEYFIPDYFRSLCSNYSIDYKRDPQIANPLPNRPMGKNSNLKRLPLVAQDFLSKTQDVSDDGSQKYLLLFGVDLEWEEAGKRIESEKEIADEKDRILDLFKLGTQKIDDDKKLLFVPIRYFDTWISYLEDQSVEKGVLEILSNVEIKNKVYGSKKSSQVKSENVVKRLLTKGLFNEDHFDRLTTQSPSFAHFHQQIIAYLQNT